MSRGQGIKKSDFPAQATIPEGATFDFVINGTNIKITKENLLTALGVTGTIVQDGASGGTPVLDTQGSVNNIRNLENGPGVKASVSPENGITLEHNFVVDATGEPIMQNKAALTPDLVSLVAGSGVGLATVDETIVITATGGQNIQEKTATYQVLVTDDIINCAGTFTVTLPNFIGAVKEVTITSTSGTITVAADVTIEGTVTIASVSSRTFYPAAGQWWQK